MRSTFLGVLSVMLLCCTACTSSPEKTNPVTTSKYVVVQVHDPNTQNVKAYPEVAADGRTKVREILERTVKAYPDFSFTDTAYIGMGHLLTGINGVRNAKGQGAYWQFCIDNVASNLGIDEMEVAPGQTLTWHYAEYGQLPCKKIGE